jgi:hypothetical protein
MKSSTEKLKQEDKVKKNNTVECKPCTGPITSGNPFLDKAFQVFLQKKNIKK